MAAALSTPLSLGFCSPLLPVRSLIPAASCVVSRCTTVRAIEHQPKLAKLLLSLLIDLVGFSTFVLPLAAEGADLAWAPVSALLVHQLYGNGLLTGLAFCEELLPATDFIPTATIGWVLENTQIGRNFNQAAADRKAGGAAAQAGGFRDGAIDVDQIKPS
eukprot:scaffold188933_cov25-Tisochrysis_lutea.AAC.1